MINIQEKEQARALPTSDWLLQIVKEADRIVQELVQRAEKDAKRHRTGTTGQHATSRDYLHTTR